jgi:hypothetical protein
MYTLSERNVILIKEYAWDNCGVELILEQAEIILMSLTNTKKYPEGWKESDLANELQTRYAD